MPMVARGINVTFVMNPSNGLITTSIQHISQQLAPLTLIVRNSIVSDEKVNRDHVPIGTNCIWGITDATLGIEKGLIPPDS